MADVATKQTAAQELEQPTGPRAITTRTSMGAISTWEAPQWNEERRALLKRAIVPPTASEAEFEFFVAWCQRTGLDPFIKQAYLVERRAKGPDGNWNVKHEPLASEAGMAARADAMPDFRGMRCAAVYAGDEFMIDEDTQTVTHRWSVAAREAKGNRVIGAWAHAKREGRTIPITWLPLKTRIQTRYDKEARKHVPTAFWERDPEGMICKCARAEQYRRTYANIFAGVFIREEMPEEIDVTPEAPPARSSSSRSDALAARLNVPKVSAEPVPTKPAAAPTPPAASRSTVNAPPKTPPKGKPAAAPAPKASPPVGEQHAPPREPPAVSEAPEPHRPMTIKVAGGGSVELGAATLPQLEQAAADGRAWLHHFPGHKDTAVVRERLEAIRQEIAERAAALDRLMDQDASTEQIVDAAGIGESEPEPGSEG